MKLIQRTVTIVLSDDARPALERAALTVPDPPTLTAFVQDTDDLGIWVRVGRTDGDHIVLVRWEYILSVDLPGGETKVVGLKP